MGIRRTRQNWFVVLLVFALVFGVTFLVQKNNDRDVEAANLSAFDAGYIISDYQMANYTSMNESQIQNFLKSKNGCNDYNTGKTNNNVGYLSESTPYSWHVKDGHYVCMADEDFNGESAAHIIWQAAQDYRINPQVLIVLLQKEQGLITDTFPNSVQYRSATGFGCPDTAACSSKYYGFKNQIRNAADLFRTVLDGGWTNYPVGNNYVKYNPNAACGGTVVNIRNRATSALYRYTPYQPNSSALASGYGTGDSCGAYGNRNFYLYFEDWFGGIKQTTRWIQMDTPRYMTVNKTTYMYDLLAGKNTSFILDAGNIYYFSDKTFTPDNRMCLRTINDKNNNSDKCIFYDELMETVWTFSDMETPRYMEAVDQAKIIDINTRTNIGNSKKINYYDKKVFLPDGDMCLRMKGENSNNCVLFSNLREVEYRKYDMEAPRYLVAKQNNVDILNPVEDKVIGLLNKEEKRLFQKKIILFNGDICLLINDNDYKDGCVRYNSLEEVWIDMDRPREMEMAINSYKINAVTMKTDYGVNLMIGLKRKFLMKRYLSSNNWCLQTEYDYERKTDNCILYQELREIKK